jgi:hypothetical protein
MFMSRRHILLGSAALLASMPALAAETSSGAAAPVAPAPQAWVKCPAVNSVPMTADAEQALPLRLVRTLSCGENVAMLSDNEGYTAHVRTADGQDGYVALMYLSKLPSGFAHATATDGQPVSATAVSGVVRWEAGAPGCNQFMSQGHLVESVTADGITVQVSLEDTGWKFRTGVAVSNNSDSTADVFPALISLDELKPSLRALHAQDPKKLAHAKEHQILWTQSNAQPSPSAVADHGGASLQEAFYHVPNYFVRDASKPSAKSATVTSDDPVSLSLKQTRLQPGHKAVGAVWFEREGNARELSLRVPVGNLIFDFPLSFDQKR